MSLVWIASHTEISSCSFPCFHHFILLFKYFTCSLFTNLHGDFWNASGRNTCSMWIATGSHFLLQLTPWLPGNDIFILWNWPKTSGFRLPYQLHSSSSDCARELFKPSKDWASLWVSNEKIFGLGFFFFLSDVISEVGFWPFWPMDVIWPRAQPLDRSVSLKFSLEARLESKSVEPLINFLAFLVQKLWYKINKLLI